MRLLVTGAAGQLGTEVVAAGRVAGYDVVASTRDDFDVTDPAAVHRAISLSRPDVVVHAAAWTAVDDCEADPERAMRVNGEATGHVVAAAADVGARVLYVSTDYVFDGTKVGPYGESDVPNPRSAYGRSKLAGERRLRDVDTVVRVSWLCGFHGANMVKTILRLMGSRPRLAFVADQVGRPSFADDVAGMIVRLAAESRTGIWHVTNQGAVSWCEFAREVVGLAGGNPMIVDAISTADLDPPRPAPRPANSVLDNAALRAAGIPLLDDFHVPLERLLRRLRAADGG